MVWRDKVIENEGSLVNRVMNEQVTGSDPEGGPEKDGETNLEDCAATL